MSDDPLPPASKVQTRKALRPLYFVAGIVLTGIGIVGYILPVMPGTIFLILAAACFARSSERLEKWLLDHPQLGPAVVAWRLRGAIPFRAKVVAITAMTLSFGGLVLMKLPGVWLVAAGVFFLACGVFVGTRPGVSEALADVARDKPPPSET